MIGSSGYFLRKWRTASAVSLPALILIIEIPAANFSSISVYFDVTVLITGISTTRQTSFTVSKGVGPFKTTPNEPCASANMLM